MTRPPRVIAGRPDDRAHFSGSSLSLPPPLLWPHPGSTRSAPVLPVGRPTKSRGTGSEGVLLGRRQPCKGKPSSKLRLREGRDFPGGPREQDANATEQP